MSNPQRKPRRKGTRRVYDPDVLAEAVDRVLIKDQPLRRTCRELDIEKMFLHRYIRKFIDAKPEDERRFFYKLLDKRRKVRMGFDPNDTSASGSTTDDEGIPISSLARPGFIPGKGTTQPVMSQFKTVKRLVPVQGRPKMSLPSGITIDLTDDDRLPEPCHVGNMSSIRGNTNLLSGSRIQEERETTNQGNALHPWSSTIYICEDGSFINEEPVHTMDMDPLQININEEQDPLEDVPPTIDTIDITEHKLPMKEEPEYSVDPLMINNIGLSSLRISKNDNSGHPLNVVSPKTSNICLYPLKIPMKKEPGYADSLIEGSIDSHEIQTKEGSGHPVGVNNQKIGNIANYSENSQCHLLDVGSLNIDNMNFCSHKVPKKLESNLVGINPTINSNENSFDRLEQEGPGQPVTLPPTVITVDLSNNKTVEMEDSGHWMDIVPLTGGEDESLSVGAKGRDDPESSVKVSTTVRNSLVLSELTLVNKRALGHSVIPFTIDHNYVSSIKTAEPNLTGHSVNDSPVAVSSDELSSDRLKNMEKLGSSVNMSHIGIVCEDKPIEDSKDEENPVHSVDKASLTLDFDNATSDKLIEKTGHDQSINGPHLPHGNNDLSYEDVTKQKDPGSVNESSLAVNNDNTVYKSTAQEECDQSMSTAILTVNSEASSSSKRRRRRKKLRELLNSSPGNIDSEKLPDEVSIEQKGPCHSKTKSSTIEVNTSSSDKASDLERHRHSKNVSSLHANGRAQAFKQTRERVEPLPKVVEVQLAEYIKAIDEMGLKQFFKKSSVLKTVQLFVDGHNLKPPFTDEESGTKWFKNFCRRYDIRYEKFEN